MTDPFYMSIEQIGELNFKQINAILEVHMKYRKRRNANIKGYKNLMPVIDITRLE